MTSAPRAFTTSARDPWFDNAKMILVTLVVIGHCLEMVRVAALENDLYKFLYAWHMPAFIIVTGYLTKSFVYSRRSLWSLVRTVLVPYILIEAVLGFFRLEVGGEQLDDLWTVTHWPMWFLLALFFWRLAAPVLRWLGWWALPLAVGLSLFAGFIAFDELAMRRTLGFLPFFVIGLNLSPRLLEIIRGVPARVAGAIALFGTWALVRWSGSGISASWLYYSDPYDELTDSTAYALMLRVVILLVGLAGALGVLALIPRRHYWFTAMGAASLVVYLGHAFVLKGVEYSGYPVWAYDNNEIALFINIVGGALLACLLASPWVARPLGHAVDPLGYAQGELRRAVELHRRADRVQAQVRTEGHYSSLS